MDQTELDVVSLEQDVRPFGMKDKIGYMLGNIGNDFTFQLASTYLMIFLTNVYGISPAFVGTLFLGARLLDAFTDIGMGVIVDQSQPTKDGRFLPWVKRMALPVSLASLMMYNIFITDWSMGAKMTYAAITYVIWGSITYTGINIPYGSMAAVISSKAADRAALSTFRTLGSLLAGLLVGVLVPIVIYTKDVSGNRVVNGNNFFIAAVAFSIIAFICYMLFAKLSVERVSLPVQEKQKLNLKDDLKDLIKDRAFIAVILNALLILVAQLSAGTLNQYLFLVYFKNTALLPLINLISLVGMAAMVPFVGKITKRFGKKEGGYRGLYIASAIYFGLFLIRPSNPWIFAIGVLFAGIAVSYYVMVSYAYITDVSDNFQIHTGKRKDGTIYSVYSFVRKLGQALAGGIGGWALAFIGYNQTALLQTASVESNIFLISVGIPAVCYLLGAIVLNFLFPLNKKKIEENERIIQNMEH
ncbi:GPH family glycoside/pentoside/hexuronide:cation symporter [Trichococcus patagoniensis]|uniref:GPH family glycoside/pentoside/hexuronide:cation symporter n=2 Tax=Trichococcus patagoniensis TaxID=382641 RepID=A0A2T5INE8_9LACT|nr:GPH family glycoside/pentoside/hexuronide:cation symporter [Trichococcus patagoniensis]